MNRNSRFSSIGKPIDNTACLFMKFKPLSQLSPLGIPCPGAMLNGTLDLQIGMILSSQNDYVACCLCVLQFLRLCLHKLIVNCHLTGCSYFDMPQRFKRFTKGLTFDILRTLLVLATTFSNWRSKSRNSYIESYQRAVYYPVSGL